MTRTSNEVNNGAENTDESIFEQRVTEDCPEYHSDSKFQSDIHQYTYTLPETKGVAVRCVCNYCGKFLGEWDSKEKALNVTAERKIGKCPRCGEGAGVNRDAGKVVDGEVWHNICWYKEQYGFNEVDEDDVYISQNSGVRADLHRTNETEIGDETFEWDEYVHPGFKQERNAVNLPTRDELRADQLEQLRKWAITENPTKGERETDKDVAVGTFPVRFILLGDYDRVAADQWVCPDCGAVVEPKVGKRVDLEASCQGCGSTEWLTRGRPYRNEQGKPCGEH